MRRVLLSLVVLSSMGMAQAAAANAGSSANPGYDDTPLLRNAAGVELPWRVHDRRRPRPDVVAGARCVSVPPPADAVVLFDGVSSAAWRSGDKPAAWAVRDGCMLAGGGDLRSAETFSDAQVHLEWRAPIENTKQGQQRGNSGVFFMERYEVQILESHGSITYADGQAAALYGQWPPLVNACAAAGEWNSYDIVFRAPQFDPEGKCTQAARVTMLHNGVLVHSERAFMGATAHKALAQYSAHGPAALRLQDHGDAVAFRNIWLRRLAASGDSK